jgi:putative DNA primase/helicase
VTFNATHTLIINTNYAPSVAETDHGTWRRLALARFPYRWLKPGAEPRSDLDRPGDPGLRERLRNGLDGQHEAVLKWLVDGAVRWYQADRVMPPIPERVERDTRAWRAESDLVLAFWDERLVADPDSNIATADMLSEFNAWLRQHGHREWSDKTLSTRLAGHDVTVSNGVEQGRTRHRKAASRPDGAFGRLPERYRTWFGVRFRDDDDDDE